MYSCKECKSEDVEVKAWWNPNTSRYVDMIEYEDGYCHSCNTTRAIVVEGISKEPVKKDSEIESLKSKLEDLTSVVELIDDKVNELDDYTNSEASLRSTKSTDFEDRVLDIFSEAIKDTVIRLVR
jgi:hypothetical protein